jgi:hypothetical protein
LVLGCFCDKIIIRKYIGENKMRKTYVSPEFEMVTFAVSDVMLSSGNKGYQSDPFDNNPFEGGNL